MNKASKEVKRWNEAHPVGVAVMSYRRRNPLRAGVETVTTSKAWVMARRLAVVKVQGREKCVLLECVKPIATK